MMDKQHREPDVSNTFAGITIPEEQQDIAPTDMVSPWVEETIDNIEDAFDGKDDTDEAEDDTAEASKY
ncbi:hypothetical protein [Paenibacillus xerothermodurans]|uniref:Uncharacterized protein n=1 Tax=Paenibacillus xerothermodurans TaxID=1977292 RepID=A0A2W1N6X9_PAEXE|nr:hypothetical protein [Paenibacillus xerothermodurans]PZE19574.1 hypothetical protein CBW46_017820 [Paenibacillus xerothermodurans]